MKDLLKIFLKPVLFSKICYFLIRPKLINFFRFRKLLVDDNIDSFKRRFSSRITTIDDQLFFLNDSDYSQVLLDKNNIKSPRHLHYGNTSNDEINKMIIKHIIKPGDICVDVGAYIGNYTLFMANLVGPKGNVYAFEPNKETILSLNNNIALNGYENIHLHDYAVGDFTGKNVFYKVDKSLGATANSTLVKNEKIVGDLKKYVKEETVNVIELDKFLENKKIKFMKIDVEGFEFNVLKGAIEIISKFRPIIIMEFISKRLKFLEINQNNFKELLDQYYNAYEIAISIKSGRASLEPFNYDRDVNIGDIILIPKFK